MPSAFRVDVGRYRNEGTPNTTEMAKRTRALNMQYRCARMINPLISRIRRCRHQTYAIEVFNWKAGFFVAQQLLDSYVRRAPGVVLCFV